MKIRELERSDAKRMLEWMQDREVTRYLDVDFSSKTIEDCSDFICNSLTDLRNLHMAIVDDEDRYMGTVSLKNIDRDNGHAEFAIVLHKDAMGKGYSKYAMDTIIKKGFEKIGLKKIYWYVSQENTRAIHFYDKHGFLKTTEIPEFVDERWINNKEKEYFWYLVEAPLLYG